MKKLVLYFVSALLILSLSMNVFAIENGKEMRAAWIATVYSTDFPSVKNNAEAQKQDFIQKLDLLKQAGMNTVVVQVRPKGDAFYKSSINPWSDVLTGVQGKDPGYDPMAFMIEEAHKRGMEFHAWLNPYRVTTNSTDIMTLCESNPARLHPEWTIAYNNALVFNPELDEVKVLIRDTVKEIVENYDVDGIHFDDYFYPSDYPLPAGEGQDGAVAQARRQHVNDMINMVHDVIKSTKPSVQFGISPMGIYKNDLTGESGGVIKGKEAYYSVYADALAWIKNGWIDYIVPQVYWETTHATAAYENVVRWWNKALEGSNVKLYIGQGIYKEAVSAEIEQHLEINQKYKNISGNFYYSARNIFENTKNCADTLRTYYSQSGTAQPAPTVETPPVTKPETNPVEQDMDLMKQAGLQGAEEENTETVKEVAALSTTSKILVNGKEIEFEAYNIEGSNYFKLRDIAMAVNGTEKQFDTLWNEADQAIDIKAGTAYSETGSDLKAGDGKNKTAKTIPVKLLLNSSLILADSYNINDNNFYKLRDIAKAVDFGITWDETANTIEVITALGYTE